MSNSLRDTPNLPEAGDTALYYGRGDTIVRGMLAERALSPLTGNPRYRVVDLGSYSDVFDPDAGRWIGVEEVYKVYAAGTEPV